MVYIDVERHTYTSCNIQWHTETTNTQDIDNTRAMCSTKKVNTEKKKQNKNKNFLKTTDRTRETRSVILLGIDEREKKSPWSEPWADDLACFWPHAGGGHVGGGHQWEVTQKGRSPSSWRLGVLLIYYMATMMATTTYMAWAEEKEEDCDINDQYGRAVLFIF